MYNICMIAASDRNYGIGLNNGLPWPHLKEDMLWFRKHTINKPCIIGRKTFESVGPLPNRKMIVVSNKIIVHDQITWAPTIETALDYGKWIADRDGSRDIMIIGGAAIYAQTMNLCNVIYLTIIDHNFQVDTWFPDIDHTQWKLDYEEVRVDEGTNLKVSMCRLVRVVPNIVDSIRTPTICLDRGSFAV